MASARGGRKNVVIRRQPDDFRVEECLTSVSSGAIAELPGPKRGIAVFRVTKVSLTTPEAAARLAKAIGVRTGDVSYAGLKDKHAATKQHLTAAGVRDPMRLVRRIGDRSTDGFEAELIGWATSPAVAGWIESNHFEIVIRAMDDADVESVRNAIARLKDPRDDRALLIVNLFGEQRFGSARHGKGFAARSLIAGNFEGAMKLLIATPARKDSGVRRTLTRVASEKWGRWSEILADAPKCPERRAIEVLASGADFRAAFASLPELTQKMCVEAYQSWLWNLIADRFIEGHAMHGPNDSNALLDLSIPTLGPGVVIEGPWATAAQETLASEGLTPESMTIPGLRRPAFGVVTRPLYVRASGTVLSEPFEDEFAAARSSKRRAIRLSFSLPRGSYATVLLRELGC